jgi:hypothetical protein
MSDHRQYEELPIDLTTAGLSVEQLRYPRCRWRAKPRPLTVVILIRFGVKFPVDGVIASPTSLFNKSFGPLLLEKQSTYPDLESQIYLTYKTKLKVGIRH